ncbi:hypothetical protein Pan216_37300 [Planctomycetes bacterium Pan216]|uniref:Lipoprotein n=1 Tax=Kolteria novifilia TaxID=2527975 RepID=A0A518B7A1_9BACT|nr:hypothetical protein Pan216_37300 [Planctomycetes bacterium Pan216]
MPYRLFVRWAMLASFPVACLTLGCSQANPEAPVVPVAGKVLFEGKPLGRGVITFMPRAGGPSAQGTIQQGAITDVVTVSDISRRSGLVAGEHQVTIRAGAGSLDGDIGMREHIPDVYNSIQKSPLSVVIGPESDNAFEFQLTMDPASANVVALGQDP